MIIEIKIHSSFHKNIPSTEKKLDGDKWDMIEGINVEQVLAILKIPDKEAMLLLINGQAVNKDHLLDEGDVLAVFPVLSGG
jgi:sulfur carrier protein ThiS